MPQTARRARAAATVSASTTHSDGPCTTASRSTSVRTRSTYGWCGVRSAWMDNLPRLATATGGTPDAQQTVARQQRTGQGEGTMFGTKSGPQATPAAEAVDPYRV